MGTSVDRKANTFVNYLLAPCYRAGTKRSFPEWAPTICHVYEVGTNSVSIPNGGRKHALGAQLRGAENPRDRQILASALADLDAKLAELDSWEIAQRSCRSEPLL